MPRGRGSRSEPATATVTRWSRAFVATGIGFFVAWQLTVAAGLSRSVTVPLGVLGFVLHVVFGNAYSLIPSYFARKLAVPRAPAMHLPFAAFGTVGIAGAGLGGTPSFVGTAGATAWLVGCLVFVVSCCWTIRDNPTGRETGTGRTDAHREGVDRLANAVVPVVFGYLFLGSSIRLANAVGLESSVIPASGPPTTHLLAAGTAALLAFAVGIRLLPRLLVATPDPTLVAVVLAAGTLGPALLVIGFRNGPVFRTGAGLQATALVGFAAVVFDLLRQSDRRRVGSWAFLGAACSAVAVALLGVRFAFFPRRGHPSAAFDAHYRLAVGGFLGLLIVGVTLHFYPPAIASVPAIGDRTARLSVVALVVGLGVEVAGLLASIPAAVDAGRWLSVLGVGLYALVLWTIFLERTRRGR